MVKIVQRSLNVLYNVGLAEDGRVGPATMAAALQIPTVSANWSLSRRFVGALQHIATQAGLNAGPIDGYWGPQTESAFEQLAAISDSGAIDNWRDNEQPPILINPTSKWPVGTTAAMTDFFGPVGTNQSKVSVPYTLKLAWDTSKKLNRFTCHKLVVEPIQAAMEEILDVYGLDFIQEHKLDYWGGCLNVRAIRGGTRYSTHSWGTSIDWNPVQNKLKWRADKAQLAQPVYDDFWLAWERQGAQSLGRAKGYDYMHVGFNQ
jgi:hypothetical protein